MAFGESNRLQTALLIITVWLIFAAEYFSLAPDPDLYFYIGLFILMAASLWGYERKNESFPNNHFMKLSLGLVFIGWMGKYLFRVRGLDIDGSAFLMIMFAIWSADVGAYVFGSLFGKTKITPNISPSKSLEGYLLGIASSILITPVFGLFLYPHFHTRSVFIIALIIGVFIPLGDLCFSLLKRQAGVKDYGGIIPGHGGIMDRLDTILWGIVPGYYLVILFNLVAT